MTDISCPQAKRVTQGDIARELGISRIAVSYALRRSSNVSKATHERVLAAAARLGYRVNAGARAMRTGSFSNLGLIKSSGWATSVLPQALLSAILREVNDRHHHLIVAQLEDEKLTNADLLPVSIREHVIDGTLIYYTHGAPKSVSDVLARVGLPAIWLNVRRRTGCVYYDEVLAGKQVGERLLAAGCREFVWVESSRLGADPEEVHYSRIDREKGYRKAIERAGFKVMNVVEPAIGNSFDLPAGISRRKGPVGIFAYSGTGVASAGLAALQKGWVPGKDVRLATVSGEAVTFGFYPVETVWLDYDGLADASLILLEKQIESPESKLPSVAVPPLLADKSPLV